MSWRERLAEYNGLDDEAKVALLSAFLAEAGKPLGAAKVRPDAGDFEVQLRGRLGEYPVRVKVQLHLGALTFELKHQQRAGTLYLDWDPEAVARPVEAPDDWSDDDDDDLTVFVHKGIFVAGDADQVRESLAVLQALPPAAVDELFASMIRQQIEQLYVRPDEIMASPDPCLPDLEDPLAAFAEVFSLLTRVVSIFSAAPPADEERIARIPISELVVCKFCGARFMPAAQPRCTNCGAPG